MFTSKIIENVISVVSSLTINATSSLNSSLRGTESSFSFIRYDKKQPKALIKRLKGKKMKINVELYGLYRVTFSKFSSNFCFD
jgi:hypothetical protein